MGLISKKVTTDFLKRKLDNWERWVPVVGYEGIYEVSHFGRVRRVKPGKGAKLGVPLKERVDSTGYEVVSLSNNCVVKKKYIHVLVCEAFHGPKPTPKHEVNHKSKTCGRRWNYYRNLEWVTRSQNVKHGYDVLGNINPKGPDSKKSKVYFVTDPNGERIKIRGLNHFCKQNGLKASAMFGVASGVCSHHKGWRCERGFD